MSTFAQSQDMSTFYELRRQKDQEEENEGWMKDWEKNTIPADMLLKDMMTRITYWFERNSSPVCAATLLAADMFERKELMHRALFYLVRNGTLIPSSSSSSTPPSSSAPPSSSSSSAPSSKAPSTPTAPKQQPPPAAPAQQPQPEEQQQPRNHHPLYKTELCRHFNTKQGCSWGDDCNYAHGSDDMNQYGKYQQKLERKRRNGLCPYVAANLHCPAGKYRCTYLHD